MRATNEKEKADVILFAAYFEDLKRVTGKTTYKILKQASMKSNYYNQCKRVIAGKDQYNKTIKLSLLTHIAKVHGYPFDLSKYIHLLDQPEENLTTPTN